MNTSKTGIWKVARPGEEYCIRVRAAETDGAYSVVEIVSSPGDSTSLHVHSKEDEYVLVLEGTARIVCGDETHDARPGSPIFLRRGVPHGWGNPTDLPIRLLMITSPGGCEEALEVIAQGGPLDFSKFAEQFQIRPVGPPILSQESVVIPGSAPSLHGSD
jgi:quercetin dioxygenase-like cupin family protein